MSFSVDKVLVNDLYYGGIDEYSDGTIENEFIEIARNGNFEEVLKKDNRWPVLYHFSDIRENLLEWYPFSRDGVLLEIGAGCGALTGLFCRKVKQVTSVELSMKRSMVNAYRNHDCVNLEIVVGNYEQIEPELGLYDYITLIGVWEYSASYISGNEPYKKMLQLAKDHLKSGGKIFVAIENKMGLKYWNGAVEDHTGIMFSGLHNYVGFNKVRTFSKKEIENLLKEVGIKKYKFYYPMPDYKIPEVIYTDKYLPSPGKERNFRKDYSGDRHYIFNDAVVTDQICYDKLFPYFANSFLILIGDDELKIDYCKYNRMRNRNYRTKIEIFIDCHGKRIVKKSPITKEAVEHVCSLPDKEKFPEQTGLPILTPMGYIKNETYITEYVEGDDLDSKFYPDNKVELLIENLKYIRSCLIKSCNGNWFYKTNEFVEWFGDNIPHTQCYSMKWTNVDFSLSNLKRDMNNRLICIDSEWVFKFPIPVEYAIWRMANATYTTYAVYLRNKMDMHEFCTNIGIEKEKLDVLKKMEEEFTEKIFGNNFEEVYLNNYVKRCLFPDVYVRI